ncbi:transporter substrate-binding domain-containing protein [Cloacibacillus porcorum]|nr:transporter substrate-binding domain-containing protein [Cloacibacillus porcorum]
MTVICFLLVFAMAIASPIELRAAEKVRVGFFPLGKFQYIDENGTAAGYNIDYLSKITDITGWEYEFVPCGNWVEATALLEGGKIDLLAPAQKIPELKEKFAYAAYPMGMELAAIYALKQRDDLIYEDIDTLAKLRYGAARNSTFTTKFIEHAKEYNISPDITYYNNTTELFDALHAKRVDAIVSNIMFYDDSLKILGRFAPLAVYYITAKDNSALLNKLDNAIYRMEVNDPTFDSGLLKKYFPHYKNTIFNYDEYLFIKNAPPIRIAYETDRAPLSFTGSDGEFHGVQRDILDEISRISGLKFDYVPCRREQTELTYLEENKLRVISGVRYCRFSAQAKRLRFSIPYLYSGNIIAGTDPLKYTGQEELRLAMVEGAASLKERVAAKYPKFKIQTYENTEQAFNAAVSGEADFVIENRYVAEPYFVKPKFRSLKILSLTRIEEPYTLATLVYYVPANDEKDWNSETFISIINKSIEQLDPQKISASVINRSAENIYKYTLGDFIYQYRGQFVILLAAAGAAIAFLLARRLKRGRFI